MVVNRQDWVRRRFGHTLVTCPLCAMEQAGFVEETPRSRAHPGNWLLAGRPPGASPVSRVRQVWDPT